jgi:hypothetical protein
MKDGCNSYLLEQQNKNQNHSRTGNASVGYLNGAHDWKIITKIIQISDASHFNQKTIQNPDHFVQFTNGWQPSCFTHSKAGLVIGLHWFKPDHCLNTNHSTLRHFLMIKNLDFACLLYLISLMNISCFTAFTFRSWCCHSKLV